MTLPDEGAGTALKKRHPELDIRKEEKLAHFRVTILNPTVVEKYTTYLSQKYSKLKLEHRPNLIWNCDETEKDNPVKLMTQKGAKNVVSRVWENRTNLAIMACVIGAGE